MLADGRTALLLVIVCSVHGVLIAPGIQSLLVPRSIPARKLHFFADRQLIEFLLGKYFTWKHACSTPSSLLALTLCPYRLSRFYWMGLQINFLTTDMQPEVRDKGDEHSASFLGFCQAQGSSCVRRIDIKIYPRR